MTNISRRGLLQAAGSLGALSSLPLALASTEAKQPLGHVVVVGGGFGGATAAKYLKLLNPELAVTLVEPNETFYTCPFSNLYLGGIREWDQIAHNYDELKNDLGVQVIHSLASAIDTQGRQVTLANGEQLSYDRLVLSPGIDMRYDSIAGYDEQAAQLAPHAWQAGEQTKILRQQLEAMPDGGLFVMVAPPNPYRCPPGPYERVSLIAHYFKEHKPNSRIVILDAKDAFSKQGLFTDGWQKHYPGMIEWISLSNDGKVVRVDAANKEVETEFGTIHKADVLNVIPPQQAGAIARQAGLTNASGWVPVKPHSFEAELAEHVYVVGDATIAAPMPKSGFCANSQAKVAAAAIVASFAGIPAPSPFFTNTCYSLVAPDYGISVAGIYNLDAEGNLQEVPGSGGLSPREADDALRRSEAQNAHRWYNAICQDVWGTKA